MKYGLMVILAVTSLAACEDPVTEADQSIDYSAPGSVIPAVVSEFNPANGQTTRHAWALESDGVGGVEVLTIADPFDLRGAAVSPKLGWYVVFVYDESDENSPPQIFVMELGKLRAGDDYEYYPLDVLQKPGDWGVVGFDLQETKIFLWHHLESNDPDVYEPWELYSLSLTDLPLPQLELLRQDNVEYQNSARYGLNPFIMAPQADQLAMHFVYTPSPWVIRQTLAVAEVPGLVYSQPTFDWVDSLPLSLTDQFPLMAPYAWSTDGTRIIALVRDTEASYPYYGGDMDLITSGLWWRSSYAVVADEQVDQSEFSSGYKPGIRLKSDASTSCADSTNGCPEFLDRNEWRVVAWAPYGDDQAILERSYVSGGGFQTYEYYLMNPTCARRDLTPVEFPGFGVLFHPAVKDELGYLYYVDFDTINPVTGRPELVRADIPDTGVTCTEDAAA